MNERTIFMNRIAVLAFVVLASCLHAEDKIPEGFEMQVMEPTGGKILRPKGWFYHEGHGANSWMWTISKEDTEGGKSPYDTGVRIQAFGEVQGRTGKSPEAFLRDFVAKKKAGAAEVHKDCDAADLGMFTRMCLEVTEGEYRILYSVFWANEIDLAIISIAGAKVAEWDANSKFFDAMSVFELIDMSRFPGDEKDGGAKPEGGKKP